LFTKYERLHGANAPSGTGIGLYLSKILVEQMQGSIGYMEREPGPGSVFWFTLPLSDVRARLAASSCTA
jgi:signal transduction histidine kinase